MRILVTGGCGYIGRHVVFHLIRARHDVTVVDRSFDEKRSSRIAGARYVKGDVADGRAMAELLKASRFEQVVHLAASVKVRESLVFPKRYFRNNAEATDLFSSLCIDAGVQRFVFASTAAVYGDAGFKVISESTPCSPISPYGESKLAAENLLREKAAKSEFSPVILRLFNAAGEDPMLPADDSGRVAKGLLHIACRAALGKSEGVELFGCDFPTPDGTAVRDFVHVKDIARSIENALAWEGRSGTFVIGSGKPTSALEVLEALQHFGFEFPIKKMQGRVGEIVYSLSDPSLAAEELGWTTQFSALSNLLRTTLQAERSKAPSER